MLETWRKAPGAVDFSVEVPSLTQSIRLASLFSNKSRAVKFNWVDGKLNVTSWRGQSGDSASQIEPSDLTGDSECLLNSRLLLQMLTNVPADNGKTGEDYQALKVDVHLNGRSACTFSWGDEMYLLLPMSPVEAEKADKEAEDEDEQGE